MKNFHPASTCPIRDILSRLGDKWTLLVLITLETNGTLRFSDIRKSLSDISQRMLTVTLRTLEADGLVTRKVYAQIPPRVEYSITPRAETLMPHLRNLVDWAIENGEAILKDRSAFFKEN